ncbi:MAG: hypothetical protein KIT80_18265 [Chitinophagaceae bacterium]|nr:hypothetical protein [Chitinophagaceae bacterium]MCW5928870.1 hypothetical protein [Chitinophagaceae bacterium]
MKITNPWESLSTERPFILEEDREAVDAYNKKVGENYKIRLEVMAVPFVGDVLNSKIVLLMLNPRFNENTIEFEDERYKEKLKRIFTHKPVDYPYFGLDPQIQVGKKYWESKLKTLIAKYGLERVSKIISNIQFHPYSSKEFKPIKNLPSQQYIIYLIEQAIERKSIIVMARGEKHWRDLVPQLCEYNYFKLKNPRNPVLSENNCPGLLKELDKNLIL